MYFYTLYLSYLLPLLGRIFINNQFLGLPKCLCPASLTQKTHSYTNSCSSKEVRTTSSRGRVHVHTLFLNSWIFKRGNANFLPLLFPLKRLLTYLSLVNLLAFIWPADHLRICNLYYFLLSLELLDERKTRDIDL